MYTGPQSPSWIAVYQWIAAHMMAGTEVSEQPESTAAPSPLAVPVPRVPRETHPAPAPRLQGSLPRDR